MASQPGGGVQAQAPAPSYTCFPTCSEIDGRFLVFNKSAATFTPAVFKTVINAAPGPVGTSSVSFEVFDADGGGLWDQASSVPLQFRLFPLGDSSSPISSSIGTWQGAGAPAMTTTCLVTAVLNDNCWSQASVPNVLSAQTSSGTYRYLLEITALGTNVNSNGFKLRTPGTFGVNPQSFSYIANAYPLSSSTAINIVNTANFNNSNYDGTWTFAFSLDGTTGLSVWDGDFDFGVPMDSNSLCEVADSDDLDTPGTSAGITTMLNDQFPAATYPGYAAELFTSLTSSTQIRAEGWGYNTQTSPSTTSPNCPSGAEFDTFAATTRRVNSAALRGAPLNGRSVAYEVIAPNGDRYPNTDPSANLEWEQFRIVTADSLPHPTAVGPLPARLSAGSTPEEAANREKADYAVESLPAGVYTLKVEGVDFTNLNSILIAHPALGLDPNETPTPEDAFYNLDGLVFLDANRDGIWNSEAGLAPATIEILQKTGPGPDDYTVYATLSSNDRPSTNSPIGYYTTRVPSGTFKVRVSAEGSGALAGLYSTTPTQSAPIVFGQNPAVTGATTNFGYAAEGVLRVTVDDVIRMYGTPNPTFTPIYSQPDLLTGSNAATCSTTATEFTNVDEGPVDIICSGLTEIPHFTIVYEPGLLTITKAPSSVAVNYVEVTYDGAPHTTTAVVSGVGSGITQDVTWIYTGDCASAPVTVAQGTSCLATASYAGDANHEPSSGENNIKINPALVIVTASSHTVMYGDPVPSVTASYNGFFGSDSATTAAACSTTYTPTSPGGTAPPTSCTGAAAANYTFSYVDGAVTILKKPVFVEVPPVLVPYDGTPKSATCTATDGLTGTITYTGIAPTVYGPTTTAPTNVGTYASSCTVPGGPGHEGPTTKTSTVTITPVVVTVTASSHTVTFGSPVPTVTPSYSGFVAGQGPSVLTNAPACTTAYTTTSPAGSTPSTSCSGATATNYTFVYVNGSVTVTAGTGTCSATGFTTYSQGGWGNNGAPGKLMQSKFSTVYPSGYVIIGGTKTLKFIGAAAITNFLPNGGTPAMLTASLVNPTSSSAGNFAAQVLALRLAVDYSAAGVLKSGLGSLVMVSGPFAGKTVNQILATANAVLGGSSSALPSGMSVSALNSIVESLNLNFHEGNTNNGLLRCGSGSAPANAPPTALDNSASTVKGQPKTIAVLPNDSDPDNDALTITSFTQPSSSKGSVVLNPNGTFTFTPRPDATGTATFTYTISDGKGGTDTATVTITITGHSEEDDCDHDRGRYGHRDGDNCDHDRTVKHHYDGDGCDHDRNKKGHRDGDNCEHDRHDGSHRDRNDDHYRDRDDDHDRGKNGHNDNDDCERERSSRRK